MLPNISDSVTYFWKRRTVYCVVISLKCAFYIEVDWGRIILIWMVSRKKSATKMLQAIGANIIMVSEYFQRALHSSHIKSLLSDYKKMSGNTIFLVSLIYDRSAQTDIGFATIVGFLPSVFRLLVVSFISLSIRMFFSPTVQFIVFCWHCLHRTHGKRNPFMFTTTNWLGKKIIDLSLMWMDAMRKWLLHIQFTLSKEVNMINKRKAKKSCLMKPITWSIY